MATGRPERPVNLKQALVAANGFSAALAGTINNFAYSGDIFVKASSIAPFSALAGRDLAGSIDLKANGLVEALTGGFDLMLDGHATGMTARHRCSRQGAGG